MHLNNNQINAILGFRKLCITYEEKRSYKYFKIWFRNGLKPMALVRRNKELTDF